VNIDTDMSLSIQHRRDCQRCLFFLLKFVGVKLRRLDMAAERKLSILINGPLPPPLGGMATYCEDYLCSPLSEEFELIFCRAILIKSVFTKKGLLRFFLRTFNSILIILVWIVMLVMRRVDISHVHTNSYGGFYVKAVLSILARIFGARTILHMHGAEFKAFYTGMARWNKWLTRRLINMNSYLIVLSKEWRDFFESIGIQKDRIVVISNSVYLPDLRSRKKASNRLTVLFMSRFERRKGIYELLAAIESRKDFLKNCRFVLAGPKTDEWHSISERIERSGLSLLVDLPGSLVGDTKDRAYREADIYILPSYAEGMPIGLLEAMSYGLACITTPVGGIPDVIRDHENGLLIEPGSVEALSMALEKIATSAELCRRIGEQARGTIQERFNWDVRTKELSCLYRKLTMRKADIMDTKVE